MRPKRQLDPESSQRKRNKKVLRDRRELRKQRRAQKGIV